jgi:hypothetical protein
MERCNVKHGDVDFLHVKELKTILIALPAKRPDLLPLVVLVCFAGLRPSEAVRVEWSEVGEDYIRLPGRKSKTGRSRQIPIQSNLKLWLALWRKDSGFICPDVSLEHVNVALRRVSGVRLSHDSMRHGFGSHRQLVVKNIGAVAEEMGNSIAICRRHYVNAFCTEAEATEWSSLGPQQDENIIAFPQNQTTVDRPNPVQAGDQAATFPLNVLSASTRGGFAWNSTARAWSSLPIALPTLRSPRMTKLAFGFRDERWRGGRWHLGATGCSDSG